MSERPSGNLPAPILETANDSMKDKELADLVKAWAKLREQRGLALEARGEFWRSRAPVLSRAADDHWQKTVCGRDGYLRAIRGFLECGAMKTRAAAYQVAGVAAQWISK